MPAAVRPLPHAASFQPAVALVTLVAPMPVIRAICLTVRCARLSLSRQASRSGAWQGLEQRRIYARQDFMRNGKGLLIGDPPAWKNLH